MAQEEEEEALLQLRFADGTLYSIDAWDAVAVLRWYAVPPPISRSRRVLEDQVDPPFLMTYVSRQLPEVPPARSSKAGDRPVAMAATPYGDGRTTKHQWPRLKPTLEMEGLRSVRFLP